MIFLDSSFPRCVITDEDDWISVAVHGGCNRILIEPDHEGEGLMMWISKDVTQEIDKNNSRIHYIYSLDELNLSKSGIETILDLQEPQKKEKEKLDEVQGTGYLADETGRVIAVVDLGKVPQDAIVETTIHPRATEETSPTKKEITGRMRKYFRR